MHQRPKISPIAAIATAVWWMRSSGRKIAPSPRSAREPDLAKAGGRALDRNHEAGVRLRQGALSRAHQKHPPSAGDLRAGQSVYGPPPSIALPTGVICLTSPLTVVNRRPHTKHRHAHSYTVTGCRNFNDGYLFATPCSDLPSVIFLT